MSEHIPECPVCGEDSWRTVVFDVRDGFLTRQVCRSCGNLCTDPNSVVIARKERTA